MINYECVTHPDCADRVAGTCLQITATERTCDRTLATRHPSLRQDGTGAVSLYRTTGPINWEVLNNLGNFLFISYFLINVKAKVENRKGQTVFACNQRALWSWKQMQHAPKKDNKNTKEASIKLHIFTKLNM